MVFRIKKPIEARYFVLHFKLKILYLAVSAEKLKVVNGRKTRTACELGIEKWIQEKKVLGQIKNIGFSVHGIHDEFLKLLDIYDWGFCLIQYNYLNANYQAGTAGLKKAAEKGLPVIVMEPLLRGKLANGLPQKAVDIFRAANISLTPAAWGLRWLWNQKEVTVVISGMNEISQLEKNITTAENAVPDMLTYKENEVYESAIKIIKESYKIPCTGYNYCMPCPKNVNPKDSSLPSLLRRNAFIK